MADRNFLKLATSVGGELAAWQLSGPWGVTAALGLGAVGYLLNRNPAHDERVQRELQLPSSGPLTPRLVYGRANVPGHLVFAWQDPESPVDLHLAYVLGRGAMEAIEGLYINDRPAVLTRHDPPTGETGDRLTCETDILDFNGGIELREYFLADGNQGASLWAKGGWSRSHRLQDWSWVHVKLTSARAERILQGQSFRTIRYWQNEDSVPNIRFLVRGLKTTWPGQTTPTFSENAAVVRYDYRKRVFGDEDASLDSTAFTSAVAECARSVEFADVLSVSCAVSQLGSERTFSPTGTDAQRTYASGHLLTNIEISATGAVHTARVNVEAATQTANTVTLTQPIGNWLRTHSVSVKITLANGGVVWLHPDDIDGEGRPTSTLRRADLSGQTDPTWHTGYASWTISAADHQKIIQQIGGTVTVALVPRTIQYPVSGIVQYSDDPRAVEEELDFAWQGAVVEHGDKVYYEPGRAYTSGARVLSADDIVQSNPFYVAPPVEERINVVACKIEQAAQANYQPYDIQLTNSDALTDDGNVRLKKRLPDVSLVSNAHTAQRLTALALRHLRLFRGSTYVLRPRDNLALLTVRPGDYVTLTDPQQGIAAERFRVVRTNVTKELTLQAYLREDPDTLFGASTALGEIDTTPLPEQATAPPTITTKDLLHDRVTVNITNAVFPQVSLEWGTLTAAPLPGAVETYTRLGRRESVDVGDDILLDSLPAETKIRIRAAWWLPTGTLVTGSVPASTVEVTTPADTAGVVSKLTWSNTEPFSIGATEESNVLDPVAPVLPEAMQADSAAIVYAALNVPTWLSVDVNTRAVTATDVAPTGPASFIWQATSGNETISQVIAVEIAMLGAEAQATLTWASGGDTMIGVTPSTQTLNPTTPTLPQAIKTGGGTITYETSGVPSYLSVNTTTRQVTANANAPSVSTFASFVWIAKSGEEAICQTISLSIAATTSVPPDFTLTELGTYSGSGMSSFTIPSTGWLWIQFAPTARKKGSQRWARAAEVRANGFRTDAISSFRQRIEGSFSVNNEGKIISGTACRIHTLALPATSGGSAITRIGGVSLSVPYDGILNTDITIPANSNILLQARRPTNPQDNEYAFSYNATINLNGGDQTFSFYRNSSSGKLSLSSFYGDGQVTVEVYSVDLKLTSGVNAFETLSSKTIPADGWVVAPVAVNRAGEGKLLDVSQLRALPVRQSSETNIGTATDSVGWYGRDSSYNLLNFLLSGHIITDNLIRLTTSPVIITGTVPAAELTFQAGGTRRIDIVEGSRVLDPVTPTLPQASSTTSGASIVYTAVDVPSWLSVDLTTRIVTAIADAPEGPESFVWIATSGDEAICLPIYVAIDDVTVAPAATLTWATAGARRFRAEAGRPVTAPLSPVLPVAVSTVDMAAIAYSTMELPTWLDVDLMTGAVTINAPAPSTEQVVSFTWIATSGNESISLPIEVDVTTGGGDVRYDSSSETSLEYWSGTAWQNVPVRDPRAGDIRYARTSPSKLERYTAMAEWEDVAVTELPVAANDVRYDNTSPSNLEYYDGDSWEDVAVPAVETFDLHDDVSTVAAALADEDRMLISDESESGDPNRYVTLASLKPFFAFDLHDDVTTQLTTLNNSDRMLISDESVSGDPNRYVTLATLKTFVADPFDLHDDVSTVAAALADEDRMLISDESESGDPNRYVTLASLKTFFTAGLSSGGGNFDLHDDVTTVIQALHNDDRMLISDESLVGDPNRYVALGALKLFFSFDLHDDVTTQLTTLHNDDRMVVSDESASRDPNRYVTLSTLKTFITAGLKNFDLHDDVTTVIPSLHNDDRMLVSDEGASGDPNRYVTLSTLKTFFTAGLSSGGGSFDLHDDVTTAISSLHAEDRMLISDESVSGDPNRYVAVGSLASYLLFRTQGNAFYSSRSRRLQYVNNTGQWANVPGFHLNIDVPTQLVGSGLDPLDKFVVADVSAANQPNRFITLQALDNRYAFDLHDDVTTQLTTLHNDDRMVVSDESASGDPTRYVTLATLKAFIGTGSTPTADPFDLHDDVTTELTTLHDDDRMVVSDESTSGDPNRFVKLSTLKTFVQPSTAAANNLTWAYELPNASGIPAQTFYPIKKGTRNFVVFNEGTRGTQRQTANADFSYASTVAGRTITYTLRFAYTTGCPVQIARSVTLARNVFQLSANAQSTADLYPRPAVLIASDGTETIYMPLTFQVVD